MKYKLIKGCFLKTSSNYSKLGWEKFSQLMQGKAVELNEKELNYIKEKVVTDGTRSNDL